MVKGGPDIVAILIGTLAGVFYTEIRGEHPALLAPLTTTQAIFIVILLAIVLYKFWGQVQNAFTKWWFLRVGPEGIVAFQIWVNLRGR